MLRMVHFKFNRTFRFMFQGIFCSLDQIKQIIIVRLSWKFNLVQFWCFVAPFCIIYKICCPVYNCTLNVSFSKGFFNKPLIDGFHLECFCLNMKCLGFFSFGIVIILFRYFRINFNLLGHS